MSQQSPAPLKTKALNSSIKSFVISSACSLFFMGALTGCQTPTGISSTPVSTSEPQTTIVITNSGVNAPVSETDSDANEAIEDYPVVDPDSFPNENQATLIDQIEPVDQTEPVESNGQAEPVEYTSVESPVTPTYREPVKRPQPEMTDKRTVQQILLDQARQNSNHSSQYKPTIEDGSNIPAFKKLMDTGVQQLRQGQLSAADNTFTRAQRLAPQSSAVYFYLGQVALKRNQPLKAEAMARRGLVVAKSDSRKKALWQVILKAAQAQGNSKVIKEARAALSR